MKLSHVGLGLGLPLLAVSGIGDTASRPGPDPRNIAPHEVVAAGEQVRGRGVSAPDDADGKSKDGDEGDEQDKGRKHRGPRDGGKNDTEDRPDTEESDETALACGGPGCDASSSAAASTP